MKVTFLLLVSVMVFSELRGQSFESIHYPHGVEMVAIGETQLAYYDSGRAGPPVLLIHGLASNMKFWKETMPALAGHRVIAVDLPGFGKSAKDSVNVAMPALAETLAGLLSELGLTRVAVVGHSMGSQVAVHLALDHPDLVDRLVLLAPAGFESFNEAESGMLKAYFTPAITCQANEAAVRLSIGMNVLSWEDRFEWLVEDRLAIRDEPDFPAYCQAVTNAVASMLDYPVRSRLGDIMAPTLVIGGAGDGLIPNRLLHSGTPEDVFGDGASAIPGATLVLIPEAGHLLMLEQPGAVNEALMEFLKR